MYIRRHHGITETQSRNLLDGNDTAVTVLELVNGVAFIELDARGIIDAVGWVCVRRKC